MDNGILTKLNVSNNSLPLRNFFWGALLIITFLTSITLKFAKPIKATEGTIKIYSTTNYSYRCFAASIQMMNLQYKILLTCRDLLYPAGEDIFTYMAWATPVTGDKAIKLGQLGVGR